MNLNSQFPEIIKYLPYLTEEEQKLFGQEKNMQTGNSLKTQLSVIEKIADKNTKKSDFLHFIYGKILFNLSEWDKIDEIKKIPGDSLYFEYWVGKTLFRQGKFIESSEVFNRLLRSESKFLQIEGKIGLSRVADRKGDKIAFASLVKQVKSEIDRELKGEQRNLFYDTLLRSVFTELWGLRSEANVVESKRKCSKFLQKAISYGDRIHVAAFYMLYGIFDKYQGNWQLAKENFNTARKIYRELGDIRGEVIIISNIASLERLEGNLDNAQGKLLSVLSFYQLWNDRRSEALVYFDLGEINSQKKYYEEAIQDFTKAKSILESINASDEQVDYAIAELYIEMKKWSEFSKIMGKIISGKNEEKISQNPHILYLYAKKEIQELNLTKARAYLSDALKAAGKKRMDHLGAKILVDTLRVIMFNYVSRIEKVKINEIIKLVEDLKLFFKETKQDLLYNRMVVDIEEPIIKISKESDPKKIRKLITLVQKNTKKLTENIRYSFETKEMQDILPNQLIVLHRSGIPVKRYVKEKKIVDDILLFGGMVRAAKDIISEVFTGEVGKVMKIDYGENIKILTEFGDKEAGVVMITQKDTFHQRRALHESVKELNKILLPTQYHGNLSKATEQQIDKIINKWFGTGYIGKKQ